MGRCHVQAGHPFLGATRCCILANVYGAGSLLGVQGILYNSREPLAARYGLVLWYSG